jgi:hypothetical protein
MQKYFFVYALSSVLYLASFSQLTTNEKIDSPKKQLPALESTEKVDRLNYLAANRRHLDVILSRRSGITVSALSVPK